MFACSRCTSSGSHDISRHWHCQQGTQSLFFSAKPTPYQYFREPKKNASHRYSVFIKGGSSRTRLPSEESRACSMAAGQAGFCLVFVCSLVLCDGTVRAKGKEKNNLIPRLYFIFHSHVPHRRTTRYRAPPLHTHIHCHPLRITRFVAPR